MNIKQLEILFLLGAGASADAGIPVSATMITKLEALLETDPSWANYKDLYFLVKSAIAYSDGLKGKAIGSNINIERLVNILDEMAKSDEHPLYPFIGAWTPAFDRIVGNNFNILSDFRRKIVSQLVGQWTHPRYTENCAYYKCFLDFQSELNFPIHIFTLNYDRCIEDACGKENIERGFDNDKVWKWSRFEEFEDGLHDDKKIFLYKMHGSIDWIDKDNDTTYIDAQLEPHNSKLIFGTSYKLQYIDPFLFLVYQFRRMTLEYAKVLVCVGYSFADEHINGIISQAMVKRNDCLLISVSPDDSLGQDRIKSILKIPDENRVIIENMGAKKFFQENLKIQYFSPYFTQTESELF